MSLLIITTMKPMIGSFITEQTNAIISWKHLRINPKIIVFGDDFGVEEFCIAHDIQNVPDIPKTDTGIPFISEIIKYGYVYAKDYDYIMYVNSDILLLDDFCDTFEAFHIAYPTVKSCLLTAVRFDVERYHKINFNENNWKEQVKIGFYGRYATPDGVDLFLHKPGNYANMPEFVIGKLAFDSWMMDFAVRNFEMSVNMTKTVKLYHHFGKWYQNNKEVSRNIANLDTRFVDHNKRLYNEANCSKWHITDAKYYSDFDRNGRIIFVKK